MTTSKRLSQHIAGFSIFAFFAIVFLFLTSALSGAAAGACVLFCLVYALIAFVYAAFIVTDLL